MRELGDEDCHPGPLIRKIEPELHLEPPCDERLEVFPDFIRRYGEILQVPLGAHEKDMLLGIHVLLQVEDVPPVLIDEFRHGSDQTFPVRAVYQQNRRPHPPFISSFFTHRNPRLSSIKDALPINRNLCHIRINPFKVQDFSLAGPISKMKSLE